MEQQRIQSGGGPLLLKRQQIMTELDDLGKELRFALNRVSERLPDRKDYNNFL